MEIVQTKTRVSCALIALTLIGITLAGCDIHTKKTDSSEKQLSLTGEELYKTRRENALDIKRCLKEHGFEVTISEDNGVESEIPGEQAEAYNSAIEECTPEQPKVDFTKVSESTLDKMYEAQIKTIECFRAEGYSPDEYVSKQKFKELLRSTQMAPGIEPNIPDSVGETEYMRLMKACPQ